MIGNDTFEETTQENATLYVPHGCKNTYWLNPIWENFKRIVEIEVAPQSGDVNGDGVVDAIDIVDIVNHMMDKPTSTGTFDEKAADANGDGMVDTADVVKVTNIIMGE